MLIAITTSEVQADGPFDVITRQVNWNITHDNSEGHYPWQPMKKFVTISDGTDGMAFLGKGLNEYEIIDDARRTMSITLLRTHRAYMLANRGMKTPEEYENQSGQHCLGPIDYEYAVYVYAGSLVNGNLIEEANDYRTPQRIIQGVPKSGTYPSTLSLLSMTPTEHIHVSGFYKRQEGDGYILRVWNSRAESVRGLLALSFKAKSITKISMDEKRKGDNLPQDKSGWTLPLRKAEIATLLIET